jgi:hypothetical protein
MNAISVVGSPSWYQTPLDPHASAAMDSNPVFTNPVFSNNSPRSTSSSSVSSGFLDEPRQASRTAVDIVQTVNIRSHVPVTLELTNPNFSEWRMFFKSALGKFGLDSHISTATAVLDRDADWYKVDQCIVNWIYTTCSPEVLQIVRQRKIDAFSLWSAIEQQFLDNQLQRAVFYEAEFRNLL